MTNEHLGGRLRDLRKQRGWTQLEVAKRLRQVARVRGESVGVNADMVAKWERGDKGISLRYRELLAILFQSPSADLAAAPAVPVSMAPGSHGHDALIDLLGETAALLDQLGPAGSMLQPKMFEIWRDEIIHRRTLIKAMAAVPAVGMMSGGQSFAMDVRSPMDTVEALNGLGQSYQALYHSTSPSALMTPVMAHLETTRDALRQVTAPALRRKILANRARVATLAGRLSFFDLNDAMGARSFYGLAHEAARQAGDHHQAAAALGHIAFIPAADHEFPAALDYLSAASGHLEKHPHGPLASWLAAIESEVHTNAGAHRAALAAVDRAREAISKPGLSPALPWFDYYDDTRLAGFVGYASLRAGQVGEARDALTHALSQLPDSAVKQRAVFLTDLAAVQLADNDLDGACRNAIAAASALRRAGYATGFDRLRQFRATVEPWRSSTAVQALDEHLVLS